MAFIMVKSTVLNFKQLRVLIQQELHFHARYDRVLHPSAGVMQTQGPTPCWSYTTRILWVWKNCGRNIAACIVLAVKKCLLSDLLSHRVFRGVRNVARALRASRMRVCGCLSTCIISQHDLHEHQNQLHTPVVRLYWCGGLWVPLVRDSIQPWVDGVKECVICSGMTQASMILTSASRMLWNIVDSCSNRSYKFPRSPSSLVLEVVRSVYGHVEAKVKVHKDCIVLWAQCLFSDFNHDCESS